MSWVEDDIRNTTIPSDHMLSPTPLASVKYHDDASSWYQEKVIVLRSSELKFCSWKKNVLENEKVVDIFERSAPRLPDLAEYYMVNDAVIGWDNYLITGNSKSGNAQHIYVFD